MRRQRLLWSLHDTHLTLLMEKSVMTQNESLRPKARPATLGTLSLMIISLTRFAPAKPNISGHQCHFCSPGQGRGLTAIEKGNKNMPLTPPHLQGKQNEDYQQKGAQEAYTVKRLWLPHGPGQAVDSIHFCMYVEFDFIAELAPSPDNVYSRCLPKASDLASGLASGRKCLLTRDTVTRA